MNWILFSKTGNAACHLFSKAALPAVLLGCLASCSPKAPKQDANTMPGAAYPNVTGSGNLQYVDPRIGNVGFLLVPTRPTVQLPNQMIRMYPVREDFIDDQISAFPLNVVSHRLGTVFSIKPTPAPVALDSWNKKMPYDIDLEVTRPWFYSTYLLEDEITVSFVPGKKVGIFRFDFPKGASKGLLFGMFNGGKSSWDFLSETELAGMETYHDTIPIYTYGTFSSKGVAGTVQGGALSDQKSVTGEKAKAYITFPEGPDSVEFRYAISNVSAEQARKNYENELSQGSFSSLENQGMAAWGQKMDQIQVEGGTEAQRRSFYTALYRCYERMVDITEDGKYFSGYDNKIHEIKDNRPFYVDDWTWDTYLAHHPLRTILEPEVENDMLNSYVQMYEQSGWMPTFPVLFGDHACMNGFHSSVMFLDAYRKGLRNYNVEKAYEGMVKNAKEATMIPWRNGPKGPLDDFYASKGYFPSLKRGEKESVSNVHPFEKRQAVAVTLGGAYDDWAVSQLAADLGKGAEAADLAARSTNYKNVWNPKYQMFAPKDGQGAWVDLDPKFDGGMGARDYYDENNGWTYLWQVQQDFPGLIALLGGQKGFENKLDQLFREPMGRSKYEFWAMLPDSSGMVGQFSMGNEPSFHIPYLYNYTASPWKTQQRIRQLLDLWYKDNIYGIPGDEDGGGMSAFVVFSSMGFYPVTPGEPLYTIGSPVFSKVTIGLHDGKKFTLIANNSSVLNKYIQSATLDGKVLNTPWFTHKQLMEGGTLVLEMGPKPNKSWGIDPKPAWN